MAWDSALEDLMADTVTVATVSATTQAASLYGVPVHATAATTMNVHWSKTRSERRDSQGNTVTVTDTIWVAGSTTTIENTAKVTLPDGRTPPILNVDHWTDGDGLYGQRVTFGF